MRSGFQFVGGLFCAAILAGSALAGDLQAVRAEPDLNKRAELAMANAESDLTAAGGAFKAGNSDNGRAALADVQASVELACDSLRGTNKPPRNNKYYKRVELSMRTLLRRVDDLGRAVAFDDRSAVEAVQKRLQELHDKILLDIMSKRKSQ